MISRCVVRHAHVVSVDVGVEAVQDWHRQVPAVTQISTMRVRNAKLFQQLKCVRG